MVSRAHNVAAHTDRIRRAGGKRTSVDLTAAGLAHLEALRDGRSTSETINHALALAANARLGTAK